MKKISIALSFFLGILSVQQSYSQDVKNLITLKDIWGSRKFYPEMMHGLTPMSDGNTYCVLDDSLLNIYSFETGKFVKTLVNTKSLIPVDSISSIDFGSFDFSGDEQKIIITTETETIYRHSSKSNYFIYEFKTKKLFPLSENGKQQLATFSPDGTKIAFVRNNNLFIKYLDTFEEQQITVDGVVNRVINGTTDWVYEEEFGFTQAFFWSSDSKKIAYYRFDESNVKEYQLEYFNGLYPEWYKYKYPKAGEANSVVDIYVYQIENQQTVKMEIGSNLDQYIPRIKWALDSGKLAIERMNRLQNHLEILLTDVSTGTYKSIYDEINPYYIDITDNLYFLPDNKQFIITSEKSGYNHVYVCNMIDGTQKPLTSGNWDITDVYGFDPVNYQIYFQSAETSPIDRQIYKINLKGKKVQLTNKQGTNTADFSTNFNYFINKNTTANTPYYVTVNDNTGKEIRLVENNAPYNEMLANYSISKKYFFEISDSSFILPNGEFVKLNAWRINPPDFDSAKKYPVLFYVYGGPGSQTVTNSWGWNDYFWFQMLAQKGIIVVSVDNRGTGARGELFKKMTYKELGKYETEDLITCANHFKALPYVDSTKIGIFGWSYGGYMSSLAITKGAASFSAAIAVAPVTNWRNYDNIYTERYMQKPQDNADGYDQNSPVNHVKELKGNYLLVHGSADDNVHYQNSMEMINALVAANRDFELMIYPNRNHGISGGGARLHLYEKMTAFLEKNLLDK